MTGKLEKRVAVITAAGSGIGAATARRFAKEGARIVIGDILVSLAGQPIARPENVQLHLQAENIGKSLTAKILRGGAVRDVSISVGDRANGGE